MARRRHFAPDQDLVHVSFNKPPPYILMDASFRIASASGWITSLRERDRGRRNRTIAAALGDPGMQSRGGETASRDVASPPSGLGPATRPNTAVVRRGRRHSRREDADVVSVHVAFERDREARVLATPLDPAGRIRGDVIASGDKLVLGDRARHLTRPGAWHPSSFRRARGGSLESESTRARARARARAVSVPAPRVDPILSRRTRSVSRRRAGARPPPPHGPR
jgi:hypothetical protein